MNSHECQVVSDHALFILSIAAVEQYFRLASFHRILLEAVIGAHKQDFTYFLRGVLSHRFVISGYLIVFSM